jgi:predicted dehydrogenase
MTGARRRIGVGVIGFGWMGQAHSRSLLRLPTLFPDRRYQPELVACSDTAPERRARATSAFGFRDGLADWRTLVEHPDVDAVWVTAPNKLHLDVIEAACAARKHVFCEKPVGRAPEATVRAAQLARTAGVTTGVGYNYRWAPLVQYAKRLIDEGAVGEIVHYEGRFFSMYGADPAARLTWRFLMDEGGFGATADVLSHALDLAHFLVGPLARVVATSATFIPERPLARPGDGTHYDRGDPDDPTGPVTNEDYVGALAVFASGAQASFAACRTFIGPESQNAFEIHGTKGALAWNLETMNELRVYLAGEQLHTGYTTVYGGDRFPYHGAFAPGSANGIGFEDLIAIEDHEFCSALGEDRPFAPGFEEALALVGVQDACIRSWSSQRWEDVQPLERPAKEVAA